MQPEQEPERGDETRRDNEPHCPNGIPRHPVDVVDRDDDRRDEGSD